VSAQNPFIQTSFESEVAGPPPDVHGVLALLEAALGEARDPRLPLTSRLRVLAASGRRLDRLYETEASALRAFERAGARARGLAAAADGLVTGELLPVLRARRMAPIPCAELASGPRRALAGNFAREISPLLTPLTVDATHPFPSVASLSINLAALVRARRSRPLRLVAVEVPPALSRLVAGPDGLLHWVEDVIGAHLQTLLPGLDVACHHAFRVTRDARPLRSSSASGTASPRTGAAVRLEVDAATPPLLRALLLQGLALGEDALHPVAGPLDPGAMAALPRLTRLRRIPREPGRPARLSGRR
jgi:polyphosphate kinase